VSDLAFIVEHECYKQGVEFGIDYGEVLNYSDRFQFISETKPDVILNNEKCDCFALSRLVTGGGKVIH